MTHRLRQQAGSYNKTGFARSLIMPTQIMGTIE
jgi:hypothetical protein